MRAIHLGTIDDSHVDFLTIKHVADAILERAGGSVRLRAEFPGLIRRAIDEVIDTPRTKRLKLAQLEKTEKTYIGTKVEILLRDFLGLPKGLLDLNVDGMDVDIKNTVTGNWMIPDEASGKPCILVASDDVKARCYLGIIVARPEYLTAGANKDNKRSISAAGMAHIHWLLHDCPYPPNFWEDVPVELAQYIMLGQSGNERLIRLFTSLPDRPIHRDIVHGVARQKDYMKRLRRNGGARDKLAAQGIAILSGAYDGMVIARLGLPPTAGDEVISHRAAAEEEYYLRQLGSID